LHFFGDRQIVRSPALGLQPYRLSVPLRLNGTCCLVELDKRKTIAVDIFKSREPCLSASPVRFDGWKREAHASL
jgi:hypothetical protein